MKAQTLGDTSSLEFMRGRRIFEINPDHPIVKDLSVRFSFTVLFVKSYVSSTFFCHAPISLSVSCICQTVTGCLQKRAWKYWSQEGGWVVIWGCADLQWVYCKCNVPMCFLLAYDGDDKYDCNVIVHFCYTAWQSSRAGRQDLRDDDHGPWREMGKVGNRGGWSHHQHWRRLFWRCHDGGSRALWSEDRERPVEGLDSSVWRCMSTGYNKSTNQSQDRGIHCW